MPATAAAVRRSLTEVWRGERRWLLPVLLLFAVKGMALALIVAPFTGHDEVDHFFYIERLAHGHGLGVFGQVLLPPEAEPYKVLTADYPANAEVIQPPLYHLLLAPAAALTPGGLFAKLFVLRLISVALGCGVVVLTAALARAWFPNDPGVQLGATAFVAMQPQLAFEAAIVNHDILVILLATLAVWLATVWAQTGLTRRRAVLLGVVVGAGILTKVSFGLMIPVVLVALWRFDRTSADLRTLARRAAIVVGTGLAVASPWFARSWWLYGDPTGAQELRTIPGYGAQASSLRAMVGSEAFWRGRLEDFWGNFGWRLIPYDPGTYHVIFLAWSAAGFGVALYIAGMGWQLRRPAGVRRMPGIDGAIVSAVWVVAMVAGVLYVGTIQFTQSRFAFPGMAAFGILTSLGYATISPPKLRPYVGIAIFAGLLVLDLVTTVRFVIPFYAGRGGSAAMLP